MFRSSGRPKFVLLLRPWQSIKRNEARHLVRKLLNVTVDSEAKAGLGYVVTAEKATFVLY